MGCWRDLVSEKKQAVLTLEAMVKSLKTLRRESWLARLEARSRLSLFKF